MRKGEYLRESPWEKTSSSDGLDVFKSKFSSKGWEVSVEEIREFWGTWDARTRRRFVSAYSRKSRVGETDYPVLDFLMEQGNPEIWMLLPKMLLQHPDRPRMLKFFSEQIVKRAAPVANYYQALAQIGSRDALAILHPMFALHKKEIDSKPTLTSPEYIFAYIDYMSCCGALASLGAGDRYKIEITNMLQHRDERVRHQASVILKAFQLE